MIQVIEKHRSKEWPSVAEFVTAADVEIVKANNSATDIDRIEPAGNWSLDADRIAAKKVRAGSAIDETYINGTGAIRIKEKYGITDQDLEPYKIRIYHSAKSVYGERGAQEHVAQRANKLAFVLGS